jgi:hypothetical protein
MLNDDYGLLGLRRKPGLVSAAVGARARVWLVLHHRSIMAPCLVAVTLTVL